MANPTVYSGAQFGCATEITATGLYIASISWDASSEQATVPDHIGTTVGVSIYNPTKEVSCDGVISSKGTGLVGSIGSTLVLTNNNALNGIPIALIESPEGVATVLSYLDGMKNAA
jgi:hypothetical protein